MNESKRLYCYAFGPIDHPWEMLPTVEWVAQAIANMEVPQAAANGTLSSDSSVKDFVADFIAAQWYAAESAGWDGTYRSSREGAPRVFWLPDPDSMQFLAAFVWKVDNNGETYVVSPIPLPWLGDEWTPARRRRSSATVAAPQPGPGPAQLGG